MCPRMTIAYKACSPDNETVVFAGGGVSGALPHSVAGDAVTLSASGISPPFFFVF